MSSRRENPGSHTAEFFIPLAADATNWIPSYKILLLGAFVFLVLGAPILVRANMPSVTVKGTLNCYDSAGNYEACATRASVSASQFTGRTTPSDQPASWTKTALYEQAIWPTTPLYQQGIWQTNAIDKPANLVASAPTARRSSAPGKSPASAVCRRHLIPCFFSALRRGFTHLASVAATKEHL
jgi:hypothetical protein